MKTIGRTLCAFFVLIFLFPVIAQAQYYGQFDNPELQRWMNRSLIYPNAAFRVVITQGNTKRSFSGSGTVIFSNLLTTAEKCNVEKNVLKDDPLCSGSVRESHMSTYVLSVDHLFERAHGGAISNGPGGEGKKVEPLSPTVWITWQDVFDPQHLQKLLETESLGANQINETPEDQTGGGKTAPIVSVSVALYVKNQNPDAPREANMQVFNVTLIDYDPKKDLALLRVDSDQQFSYVAPIASKGTTLSPFDTVLAVGMPVGIGPVVTVGSFFYDWKIPGEVEDQYFVTSTPIGPGNSGGGLYRHHQADDGPRFELVGVVRAVGNSNLGIISHTAISVTLFQLQEFLEKNYLGFLFSK